MSILTHMAEQMTLLRFNTMSPLLNYEDGSENLNYESVDLDNLFAFLSDVTSSTSDNAISAPTSSTIPCIKEDLDVEIGFCVTNKGIPSLSEPIIPPPPLPSSNDQYMNNILNQHGLEKEHIYEAVVIKSSPTKANQCDDNLKTIISANFAPDVIDYFDHDNSDNNTPSTTTHLAIDNPPLKHSINTNDIFSEREQRRKFRVEKKILEMTQRSIEAQHDSHNNDVFYDVMEFAKNYFNIHEQTPDETLIATLTRKSKKNTNNISVNEMVTFLKGDNIQSSHIHLYDPENVVLACSIFRVSNLFMPPAEFFAIRFETLRNINRSLYM